VVWPLSKFLATRLPGKVHISGVGRPLIVVAKFLKKHFLDRAGFANRLCRLKPRASRSEGASNKLWYAWSQLPVYDQIDKYSSTIYALNSWNLVLFNWSDFEVITPESSNEFPWISIWRLAKSTILCRHTHSTLAAFAESHRFLRVNQTKELVAVRVWNARDQWGNLRGVGEWTAPWQAKCKIGPPLSFYFDILLVFNRLLLFCVFRSVFRWFRVLV